MPNQTTPTSFSGETFNTLTNQADDVHFTSFNQIKWLMLCREPRLYSCQRLKQACQARDIQLDIIDPNRCALSLEQGKWVIDYQVSEPHCKTMPIFDRLHGYNAVLPRFGVTSNEMGLNVLRHFELSGVPSLNSSRAFRLARDKWQSLQALQAQQISVPDTRLTGELFSLKQSVNQMSAPLIAKTLTGSQGVGVMLLESESSAVSLLETLRQARVPNLLQAFIAEAKGEDIRAFVVGGQVVAAMKRIGHSGEFRANIHQGGRAEQVRLSESEQAIAVRAARAIGLDVAGVDLIRSAQGLLVLEVNASPGLEMIEKVSNVDIASLMVATLLKRCRPDLSI